MRKHRKISGDELFIVAALLLFLIPGLCAIYSGIHRAVEKKRSPEVNPQDIAFSAEYPFSGSDAERTAAEESTAPKNVLAVANKVTAYVDFFSGQNNIISPFFLKIYGKTTEILGKKMINDAENPVIRLENGYLTYAYLLPQESVQYAGVLDFNEWLKEKNIPFLFVMPAEKSDDRYAVYPQGFPKGSGNPEKEYHEYLEDNGISYLNARDRLISENEDFYFWFYKTDHHWNVRAGFSVAGAIAQRLKTEFGLAVDTDILNRNEFRSVTYPNVFLGSQGKKVTHGYIAPEDFEVYYPLFDSVFSIEIPTKKLERTDTFENTLLEAAALEEGNYYRNNAYDAFLHGDVPLVRIHNRNCNNGTRALMIKTSDANVVDTYLAFAVEYLDIIDPRHFDGSVRTFIEKTHPDVVLSCAYPSEVLDNKMLDIK